MRELDAVVVCCDLSGRYGRAFDNRLVDDYLDCFTPDGIFRSRFPDGREQLRKGHESLREFLVSRGPAGAAGHVAYAPAVLSVQADEILASVPFARVSVSDEHPLDVWGVYLDRIVPGLDGRWRFASREATVSWLSPSFTVAL